LKAVVDDVVSSHFADDEDGDPTRRYRINVILTRDGEEECPIIVENTPTLASLLGVIERRGRGDDTPLPDHLSIRSGSLLRAHGGYLVLEARDVLAEPAAWKALMRTLRTGQLDLEPPDRGSNNSPVPLKPEPIELHVKVVLIGDPDVHYMLNEFDEDFPNLFKVLADFD